MVETAAHDHLQSFLFGEERAAVFITYLRGQVARNMYSHSLPTSSLAYSNCSTWLKWERTFLLSSRKD